MSKLAKTLLEKLNVDTAFTIPLFGGIAVAESTVVMWMIMAVMVAIAIFLTWHMDVHCTSKRQLVAETLVNWLDGFTGEMLGEHARQYSEYISTVLLYLIFANISGIFGVKPPTKDLDVTAGLAIMSIILVEYAGIRALGAGGWLKSFAKPVAVVTPLNIMEIGIRPLSLCMRLFGNVLGSFVIMELIENVIPVIVPAVLSLYFDIFDGVIQAYVFVFLTSLFTAEAVEMN